MSSAVKRRLALIPGMGKTQLLTLWKELFRLPPPRKVRRDLLIKLLAYRTQEEVYGGLSPASRKRLGELARKLQANPNAEFSVLPRIKPGTRLVRDWRGRCYRVTILESGFEYAGQRYSSLSKIARLVTGTRWSGPLFFGLRGRNVREHADAMRS